MKKAIPPLLCCCLVAGLLAGCQSPESTMPVSSAPPSVSGPASQAPAASAPQQPAAPAALNPAVLTGLALPDGTAQDRRITAVVVDNVKQARPQRGLSEAGILFECLVEGGITRLMALYADYRTMPQVGPVRSSRDQFFQLAYPFEAILVTDGSSQMLDNHLEIYDYRGHTLDTRNGYGDIVLLDEERLADGYDALHARYTGAQQVTDALADGSVSGERTYGSTFFLFEPYDQPPRALAGDSAERVVIHHSSHYTTALTLENGRYAVGQSDADGVVVPSVDENTGETLAFDNALVLFAEMPAYPGLTADVRNVQFGYGGVGYYFNGGTAERIRWVKDSPMHGLRLMDADGNETDITLNPGTTYVALVDVEMAGQLAYGAAGAEASLDDRGV